MFSQLIVTKHWTKEKKLWNLPSISELWISILEALTSPARIFQSSQSLCCHHLCLWLNIRDRSWKTTQHLVENRVVITLSLLEHQISELKNNITLGRKQKKGVNLSFFASELWISILEAIYICRKDLPKLRKSVLSSPLSLLEYQRSKLKNSTTNVIT